MNTTPTPETDAFYWRHKGIAPVGRTAPEWEEFARKLERERDDARHQLNTARDCFQHWRAEAKSLKDHYRVACQSASDERDQLRKDIETMELRHVAVMMNTQAVVDENNQLRKVADELATWLEITNPDSRYKPIMPDDVAVNAALDSYNALPHVKKGQS